MSPGQNGFEALAYVVGVFTGAIILLLTLGGDTVAASLAGGIGLVATSLLGLLGILRAKDLI